MELRTEISYPSDNRPHIQRKHTDGPLLSLRDGRLHWLTWWERLLVAFGKTDALTLEKKYWSRL